MKCIDLFAGCGGLSLGVSQAGFEVLQAFDHWQPAIAVYEKNFNHPIHAKDLSKEADFIDFLKKSSPDIDLIMGGPPCQDFSSAGKRNTLGERADLTYHFANIVCAIKPQWFIMENVEQIKKTLPLQEVVQQFIDNGYGLSSIILDASFCGVPQARTRFFLIGHLGDQHNKLVNIYKQKLSKQPLTLKDYFGDKLGIKYYYRHPRNYNRRGIFSIDEPSPTVRGVNRPVPQGYQINGCDPMGVDLKNIRPLTTLERSYVQTFPENFHWQGTKTDLEQMIGNAVPPKLAQFIAEGILYYQKNGAQSVSLLDDFEHFHLSTSVLMA
jgi:DNA (cytosine-5)-methyltransferase 1